MVVRYEKVRVGLMGWNDQAAVLCNLLLRYTKHIDLIAIATDEESARAHAIRNLGVKHVFVEFRSLLELHEIDAIILLESNKTVLPYISSALLANYHILFSPTFNSLEEVSKAINLIQQRPTQVALPWTCPRFDNTWHKPEMKSFLVRQEIEKMAITVKVNNKDAAVDSLLFQALWQSLDILQWIADSKVAWISSEAIDASRYEFLIRMDNSIIATVSILFTTEHDANQITLYSKTDETTCPLNIAFTRASKNAVESDSFLPESAYQMLRNLDEWLHCIQEKVRPKYHLLDLMDNYKSVRSAQKSISSDGRVVVL